jgi:hypothetical protein
LFGDNFISLPEVPSVVNIRYWFLCFNIFYAHLMPKSQTYPSMENHRCVNGLYGHPMLQLDNYKSSLIIKWHQHTLTKTSNIPHHQHTNKPQAQACCLQITHLTTPLLIEPYHTLQHLSTWLSTNYIRSIIITKGQRLQYQ